MKKRKKLRDLNLLDRFLFSEAMEDKEFAENILSINDLEDCVREEC